MISGMAAVKLGGFIAGSAGVPIMNKVLQKSFNITVGDAVKIVGSKLGQGTLSALKFAGGATKFVGGKVGNGVKFVGSKVGSGIMAGADMVHVKNHTLGNGIRTLGGAAKKSVIYKNVHGTEFSRTVSPYKAGPVMGLGIVPAAAVGVSLAGAWLDGRGSSRLGRVKYTDGPARMTKPYTTGAVEAMKEASGGNYAVFADMAKGVVHHTPTFHGIGFNYDDHGVDGKLISALYGMGR